MAVRVSAARGASRSTPGPPQRFAFQLTRFDEWFAIRPSFGAAGNGNGHG
jgi:hypothetical protein